MNDDINYTKEAFFTSWNLVFLISVVAMATGIGFLGTVPAWLPELILVLGAGLELLYLGVMPRHERFRRHVRSQKIEERRKAPSQRELFSQLRNRSQRRYAKLRKLKDEIRTNYQRLSYASQGLLDNHISKIDGLLESYLELLHQRERYQDFRDRATEAEIRKSMGALKRDMEDDAERVRAVKERRLKVLEQRLARYHKARENLEIIGAQLGTIEDVVKYIHEQSWTLQNPEEVTMQLDALLDEVEATRSSILEIEDVFSAPSDYIDDELEALDEELDAATEEDLDLVEEEVSVPDESSQSGSQQSRVRE